MKRAMIWTTALMMVLAGFAMMSENQASAGLFGKNKCKPAKCKKVRKSKCCQPVACCPAPCETAAATISEAPANPCGCPEATADCGRETKYQTCCTRRQIRQAKRKGCRAQQCGCSGATTSPAGTEKAPDLPEDATT